MLVLDNLHLDYDTHLTANTVEGVKDREPPVKRVGQPTVCQRVETDVDLTNCVVSSVRVVVH